jgi:lipopolysaccharide/colanic/teichoic acid biosynthesis glycosyltransferase
MNSSSEVIKKSLDILVSALGLIISTPLWPLIALAAKLDSRGPVFYIQRRVGRDGREFSLIKFRSMIDKAEETGPLWAKDNDERITRVGRVLRRLHLDEWPQLLNVIRGEMSLVGPRPERPEFVEKLEEAIPGFGRRHKVKPGITGWAQVKFPYASTFEESEKKLEYDLYYISHQGLMFDLKILWLTGLKLIKDIWKAGNKQEIERG